MALGAHLLNRNGKLPVPKLANVEVTVLSERAQIVGPAQEDVTGRLHQTLTRHNPLPLVVVARPRYPARTESRASLV